MFDSLTTVPSGPLMITAVVCFAVVASVVFTAISLFSATLHARLISTVGAWTALLFAVAALVRVFSAFQK